MYLPHGDAYHAPIAGEDIGRTVAAILGNPEKYNRERLILTGPERLSQSDIAAIASKVLSKPIEYVSLPYDQWAEAMKQTGLLSDFLIKHLVEVGKDYQNDVFDKLHQVLPYYRKEKCTYRTVMLIMPPLLGKISGTP